jgi:hypothetical protein
LGSPGPIIQREKEKPQEKEKEKEKDIFSSVFEKSAEVGKSDITDSVGFYKF